MSQPFYFIFSETGGGHRASATAVQAALSQEAPGARVELLDLFIDLSPFPLNRLPLLYRPAVDLAAPLWSAAWRLTAQPGPGRSALALLAWLQRDRIRLALSLGHPRAVVSFHPLANDTFLQARQQLRLNLPIVTVVTDLVTAHPFWFAPEVDLCLVPTPGAAGRALAAGLPSSKVEVLGLPIHPGVEPVEDARPFRERLGLAQHPTVLLVGGGEGMGGLALVARAVARSGLDLQLLVVAGRNRALRSQLEAESWPIPVRVYGFVDHMPQLMAASDVLVTKAGPSTIVEGLTTGLPIILMGFIPGQEEGNVSFVVDNGAGLLAPTPEAIVEGLRALLQGDGRLVEMKARARALAMPGAAARIAHRLLSLPAGSSDPSAGHAKGVSKA